MNEFLKIIFIEYHFKIQDFYSVHAFSTWLYLIDMKFLFLQIQYLLLIIIIIIKGEKFKLHNEKYLTRSIQFVELFLLEHASLKSFFLKKMFHSFDDTFY